VWLASNAGGMAQEDKSKVLRELELTQAALDIEANGQEKSMAAYTSRLIAHWIKKTESPADRADQPAQPTPFVTASLNSHFFDAEWGQQQPVWQPDLGQALTVSVAAHELCLDCVWLIWSSGGAPRTGMAWERIHSSPR